MVVRDSYPLPCIDQIMDQVMGSHWFSKFDMKLGTNQIQIREGNEWLAVFITPEGPWEMNMIPTLTPQKESEQFDDSRA
jgi:hypothetical protein